MHDVNSLKTILQRIYGMDIGTHAFQRIAPRIAEFPPLSPGGREYFSEKDAYLITYGDTLFEKGKPPLQAFHAFASAYLKGIMRHVHFLPFFPYSSDDGFSVIDFFTVDPNLGTWVDISRIANDFHLMFDWVINHFSAQSPWFEAYLASAEGFEDLAIEVDPRIDLSTVIRPRTMPLLSPYIKKKKQTVHVWTTFSADQIDFNYRSINVLEKMVEVLLFYIRQGARALRLDAVAYLWKEIGTNCIHRPQTHDMVKLFRNILDIIAPEVILITETNVPHVENISYFGNGRDEAQMVYNFTLPPLLLYSFLQENAETFSEWAASLVLSSESNTFFNFTASHDGIGVRPLEGILPSVEIERMIDAVRAAGGDVSSKQNPDGSQSAYELNITYIDAILGDEQMDSAEKFLASQAIQYALPGVPATYIHSLLGSRNWHAGVRQTGRARTINRKKLHLPSIIATLEDRTSFRSRIFFAYCHLIRTRTAQPAFHPNAAFEILHLAPQLFAIQRQGGGQLLLSVTNVSSRIISTPLPAPFYGEALDVLTGMRIKTVPLTLKPYQFVWLVKNSPSNDPYR